MSGRRGGLRTICGQETLHAAGRVSRVVVHLLSYVVLAAVILATRSAVAGDGVACRDQAAVAEQTAGIPKGLLLAIGVRESGRFDATVGGVIPWPWAVNIEGDGHLFETKAEAIAFVADALRTGRESIDVGCFQINLKYHPTAFGSLADAFDPASNASYAGHFLQTLYARERSWEAAAADYHSSDPSIGGPYAMQVLDAWHGISGSRPVGGGHQDPIPQYAAYRVFMGIKIWAGSYNPPAARGIIPVSGRRSFKTGQGLPTVITPTATVRQSYAVYQ